MNGKTFDTYMTEKLGPLPFCPGCGHHTLTRALNAALVNLQPDPRKVVIVTDIGCIGLVDRYFVTGAFHGLHGRSVTYGCGLKLARPELTVIVLQGDGGSGIGFNHLVNAARRNIGITLIVGNNLNYGMTGGQHSVTTPVGGLTTTTPSGNLEQPLDLCRTIGAAGGSWIHRTTTFEKDLADTITRALELPGFSMIDVWELCVAYYSPRNRLKKKDLYDFMDENGFERGQIADSPRPDYMNRYLDQHGTKGETGSSQQIIETCFSHSVPKQTGIILAGSAGQRVRSTATLFSMGAMMSGLEVSQKDDYPITVMTGHSVSEVILSPESIEYTAIDTPDYMIVLSQDGLKRTGARIAELPESSTLFIDDALEIPATEARTISLPLSRETGTSRRFAGTYRAMAAMLAQSSLFPVDAFVSAVSKFGRARYVGASLEAIESGIALVRR